MTSFEEWWATASIGWILDNSDNATRKIVLAAYNEGRRSAFEQSEARVSERGHSVYGFYNGWFGDWFRALAQEGTGDDG